MNEWKECTLGELIDSGYSSIHNTMRQPLSAMERDKMKHGELYPYYGAANAIDFINQYRFDGFYLLVAEDGTVTSNGIAPMLQLVEGKFWVSNHAHILQCISKWQTKLLYYLLRNVDINPYITGAVQPKLSKANLLSIQLFFPISEFEQRAIAGVLSSLDEKIDLLHRQNKTLEAMAEAIFRQWFIEEADEKWEEKQLGELITVKRGGSPRPIQDYLSETGYLWLKISDATNEKSPYIFEVKEHIKKSGLSKTILLKKGSLVLSNSATPGIPKILEVDACIHDGWLYFPNSYFSKEFLYLLFKTIRENLISYGNGSIFINLKTDILKNYKILVPEEKDLLVFQRKIESYFNKIIQNCIQIRTLEKFRDTLLPKLMSGEVRVI